MSGLDALAKAKVNLGQRPAQLLRYEFSFHGHCCLMAHLWIQSVEIV